MVGGQQYEGADRRGWAQSRVQPRREFGGALGGAGSRALGYGLVTDEVRIEDAAGRSRQVGSLTQAADDHAVKVQNSVRDCQELRPHAEHRAELVELGPAGARNQVRQNVGVAVEMGDAKAPVERPARRGWPCWVRRPPKERGRGDERIRSWLPPNLKTEPRPREEQGASAGPQPAARGRDREAAACQETHASVYLGR